MGSEGARQSEGIGAMNHREIKLADGRYLFFYTFAGSPVSAGEPQQKTTHTKEPNSLRAESLKEPYV